MMIRESDKVIKENMLLVFLGGFEGKWTSAICKAKIRKFGQLRLGFH